MTFEPAAGGTTSRREAGAFLDTLQSIPPDAVTACRGWTTHEIVAHLASGADALADQVEAHLEGRPVPEFGSWEEREPPYRAIPDAALRRRLEVAEERMMASLEAVLAEDPAAAVPTVGWGFPVAELVNHMRQEFAIHRWDLVGDDAAGTELLAQPELLGHSVRMLGDPLLASGLRRDESPSIPLSVRLRCPGQPDLLIETRDGTGKIALCHPVDAPDMIETDPAARLLLLWGRRPADACRVQSRLSPEKLMRLQTLLSGF